MDSKEEGREKFRKSMMRNTLSELLPQQYIMKKLLQIVNIYQS